MSREIGAPNVAEVTAEHLERVALVHMAFDDPLFVHSGLGIITFDGDEYIGIGTLGTIADAKESEALGPAALTFTLSGVDMNLVAEALDAARYGDAITVYEGYVDDAGALVSDPWIIWAGKVDATGAVIGTDPSVSVIGQHDISSLDEIDGSRWTNEDQQAKFSGDKFFEHIAAVPNLKLLWGGGPTTTGSGTTDRHRRND